MREMNGSLTGWRDGFLGKSDTLCLNPVRRCLSLHYHLNKNTVLSITHSFTSNFGAVVLRHFARRFFDQRSLFDRL